MIAGAERGRLLLQGCVGRRADVGNGGCTRGAKETEEREGSSLQYVRVILLIDTSGQAVRLVLSSAGPTGSGCLRSKPCVRPQKQPSAKIKVIKKNRSEGGWWWWWWWGTSSNNSHHTLSFLQLTPSPYHRTLSCPGHAHLR